MKDIYDRIRDFWDRNPCGANATPHKAGARKFFESFDGWYGEFYSYMDEFLDTLSLRGKNVLEIGLGSGYELAQISAHSNRAVAVDISYKTLELCERRKQFAAIAFDSFQASATDLPFKSESFDVVITIGCLHHIPEIQKAIGEIHRVLRPGGRLLGMVYNKNSWRFRVYFPLCKLIDFSWRHKSAQEMVSQHYDGMANPYGAVYSRKEMIAMLKGFSNLQFQAQNFQGSELIPNYWRLFPRKFWTDTFGRIAGLDLYFKAMKTN